MVHDLLGKARVSILETPLSFSHNWKDVFIMTNKKVALWEVFEEKTPTLLVTIDGYDLYNDNTLVSPIELNAIALQENIFSNELYEIETKELPQAVQDLKEHIGYNLEDIYIEKIADLVEEIKYKKGLLDQYAEWYQWCEVREDDGTFWPNEKINEWLYYNRFNLV